MSLKEDQFITQPAAKLALAAPQEWANFLTAVRKLEEFQRGLLVQAPLEELQKSQGRAQALNGIANLLEDAVKAAAVMNNRQPVRPRN